MSQTNWISVKDKLPDENVDVLVLGTSGWIEVKHYVAQHGNYMWGWYPGGCPIVNTSHWAHLPEPPSLPTPRAADGAKRPRKIKASADTPRR